MKVDEDNEIEDWLLARYLFLISRKRSKHLKSRKKRKKTSLIKEWNKCFFL